MKPRREKWWTPNAYLDHIYESECPVSAITGRSFELVQLVHSLRMVKESTGSTIAADALPGAVYDAIRVCEAESRAADEADERRRKAER